MKPIIIQAQMKDKKGILIPKGVIAYLTCEIYEGKAVFQFNDWRITYKFAMLAIAEERKNGEEKTFYSQRLQKALTNYEGKSQEEVKDIVIKDLNKIGVKIKNA